MTLNGIISLPSFHRIQILATRLRFGIFLGKLLLLHMCRNGHISTYGLTFDYSCSDTKFLAIGRRLCRLNVVQKPIAPFGDIPGCAAHAAANKN